MSGLMFIHCKFSDDRRKSKVPQFGAWEGGENFTVFFDNARKMKMNGAMINPNDPEEYANMFPQKIGASAQARPSYKSGESQEKQSKVPKFGAWDNGGNVGYTQCFENARETKNVGPQYPENEAQTCRPTSNPKPQEARPKVPNFGAWENGSEFAYTVCFDKIRKTNNGPTSSNEPEPPVRRDGGERARRGSEANGRSSEHMVQGGVRVRSEHGSTREGHMRNASRGSVASMAGSETNQRHVRLAPGGQAALHLRAKPQSIPGSRGSQNPEKGAMIPPFGVWNKDPSQAEDFTGTFRRAVEEKKTPLNKNTPASYCQQTQQYKHERKKRSWFSCFG